MPDTNEQKQDKKTKDEAKQNQDGKTKKFSISAIIPWLIASIVIMIFAGSGFLLGRLFAGQSAPEETENVPQKQSETKSEKIWYYYMEPVTANLNEPGATRYVRATVTLEMSSELSQQDAKSLLTKKQDILTNWLTIYLSSLTLEDARGDRNLKRIQLQILDAFNEILFPDAKPMIKHILFKEFAIQ